MSATASKTGGKLLGRIFSREVRAAKKAGYDYKRGEFERSRDQRRRLLASLYPVVKPITFWDRVRAAWNILRGKRGPWD